jgi:predicted DNA-binding transcriptional regulator AlpA
MQEVCAQLKCGRKRLYALIRNEGFPKYARVGKSNFFYDDAITAWRRTRPDLFPPTCYAEAPLNIVGIDPSMEKMYRKVQAEKQEQAAIDREREETERAQAKLLAQERAQAKEREQRTLWKGLAPKPEPPSPHQDSSQLSLRKVRAALKANQSKHRKGK